jgi:hypothetical protein
MTYDTEQIFNLLPSIYRLRDAEQGGVLESLLSVLAREIGIVDDDIAQLYENWFMRRATSGSCHNWRPVGVRGCIPSVGHLQPASLMANTLAYRRRKGTCHDAGAAAHVQVGPPVPWSSSNCATTQYMNHIRLHNRCTSGFARHERTDPAEWAVRACGHTADVGAWHRVPPARQVQHPESGFSCGVCRVTR